jgi:hypothetical protein
MPLDRALVAVGRTQFNEPIIHCAHCHQPADYDQTIDELGNARYELTCPQPQQGGPVTLGSWPNEEQRALEIGQFIEGQTRPR